MTLADLGCGESKSPGSLGIDVRKVKGVDIVADVSQLPLADEALDGISAQDILEHFSFRRTAAILSEWARVLKSGGAIFVKTPNVQILAQAYISRQIPLHEFVRKMYGNSDYGQNHHYAGNDPASLREWLAQAGFKRIRIEAGSGNDWSNVLAYAVK